MTIDPKPQSMEEIAEELELMQRVGLIPHQDQLEDERGVEGAERAEIDDEL